MIFNIRKEDEYIKLGQLLKACSLVSSGSEAKIIIKDGSVKVNGEICLMRGKKIYRGDNIFYKNEKVEVF